MIAPRVLEALRQAGIEPRVHHDPVGMHTAQQAAAAVGAEVAAIVKSLVFMAGAEPVLVLTSGARRVDTDALGRLLGAPVRRADAETVRRVTGYAIGGVPPVGHAQPLRTLADPALLRHEEVWAAGGRPDTVFACAPGALLAACRAELVDDGVFAG